MSDLTKVTHIDNVRLGDDCRSVVIIDQTRLPNRTEYLTLRTAEEMYEAIRLLRVRGAPAIGICAGYCLYALAEQTEERGMEFKVFSDETRPLLQGARLTSYELQRAGIDVTLICDNMASIVMKNGWIQACFVGCDRVAANGDAANKIGTSGVAILAKHYGIPFYVLGPTSTIDMTCATGADIEIELRDPDEIKSKFYVEPMALPEIKCYNPAFDVTDHTLIAGIVTEKGICRAPYTQSLAALF